MSHNADMHDAKRKKNDEFYTSLSDIEREVIHYKKHFKGKVVYCNCDEPEVSWFHWYFRAQFQNLGLKALITSCYKSINPKSRSRHDVQHGWVQKYVAGKNGQPRLTIDRQLKDDGDFRKAENIKLLKQADIVVTNPPFSLFREFIAQLVAHKKKFLIIGNVNAITYKEVFPLLKSNKLWLGVSITSGDREFGVPDNYPLNAATHRIDKDGRKYIRVKGVRWFTNLSHEKRKEMLSLHRQHKRDKSAYPVYDNYNAIEVGAVAEIPCDYAGVMGVPITFMDKYNPDQFEILGSDYEIKDGLLPELLKRRWKGKIDRGYLDGKRLYSRLIIKHKNPQRR